MVGYLSRLVTVVIIYMYQVSITLFGHSETLELEAFHVLQELITILYMDMCIILYALLINFGDELISNCINCVVKGEVATGFLPSCTQVG